MKPDLIREAMEIERMGCLDKIADAQNLSTVWKTILPKIKGYTPIERTTDNIDQHRRASSCSQAHNKSEMGMHCQRQPMDHYGKTIFFSCYFLSHTEYPYKNYIQIE